MRYSRLIVSGILLSSLLGGLVLFFKYQHQATAIIEEPQGPLASAEGIFVREYNAKSDCLFILNASNVKVPLGQQQMTCNNTTITMVKDHQTTATLHVLQAHLDRIKNIITCSQQITGTMHGIAIATTACNYTIPTHMLAISAPLEVTAKNMYTTAPQAIINLQTGTITCDHGIKTELVVPLKRTTRHNSR